MPDRERQKGELSSPSTEARTCEDDWALNSCKGEEKKKMKRSSYLFSFSRAANEIKNAPRQFTRYLTQWNFAGMRGVCFRSK